MAAFFGADEIWSRADGTDEKERVILAGVWKTTDKEFVSEEDFRHSLAELSELAKACYMEVLDVVTQQLPRVDQGLYVRSGKAAEIAASFSMTRSRRPRSGTFRSF